MGQTRVSIHGVERTIKALRFWGKKHSDAQFTVSYAAPYAISVHENLNARHVVGQAKFLEQPARTQGNAIAGVTRQAVARGLPLEEGLRLGAVRLLELSRALVPIDTGMLRDSGTVRKEA